MSEYAPRVLAVTSPPPTQTIRCSSGNRNAESACHGVEINIEGGCGVTVSGVRIHRVPRRTSNDHHQHHRVTTEIEFRVCSGKERVGGGEGVGCG